MPQSSSTPAFSRLVSTSLDIIERGKEREGSRGFEVPASCSTPGVPVFQVFVPGTCTLSWVSTRVFCSHLDLSTTSLQSSVLQKPRPLLKFGKNARKERKKEEKDTFSATFPPSLLSPGLYVHRGFEATVWFWDSHPHKLFYMFENYHFVAFLCFFDWVWNSTCIAYFRAVKRTTFEQFSRLFSELFSLKLCKRWPELWMKYLLKKSARLHEETQRGSRWNSVLVIHTWATILFYFLLFVLLFLSDTPWSRCWCCV